MEDAQRKRQFLFSGCTVLFPKSKKSQTSLTSSVELLLKIAGCNADYSGWPEMHLLIISNTLCLPNKQCE